MFPLRERELEVGLGFEPLFGDAREVDALSLLQDAQRLGKDFGEQKDRLGTFGVVAGRGVVSVAAQEKGEKEAAIGKAHRGSVVPVEDFIDFGTEQRIRVAVGGAIGKLHSSGLGDRPHDEVDSRSFPQSQSVHLFLGHAECKAVSPPLESANHSIYRL
jgi:hypothetical protein